MKNAIFVISFILISFKLCANTPLHYAACDLASKHLIEVNKEWQKQLPETLDYYINFKSEDDRIAFHLKVVIEVLKSKTSVKDFCDLEKTNRLTLLDQLLKYSHQKTFPINRYHKNRQPYFVDHQDTHCAVGHLLKCTGDMALIDKIKSDNNYAFIKEMTFPELGNWSDRYGFTKNELALIQPAYPSAELNWQPWGDGNGIDGKINVMKATPDQSLLIIAGDFTAVDGITADNVIAFDGSEWRTMSDGVDGIVNDIAISDDNDIYIGGEFMLDGVKVNIAKWNNDQWISMSNGSNGIIYTLQLYKNKLYVGGEFTEINGLTTSNLAYFDFLTQLWSTDSTDGKEDVFSVDGVVRDMDLTNLDSLVIGGRFNKTGVLSSAMDINRDSCYNLTFWNGNDWEHKYADPAIPEVHCLSTSQTIYVGGDMTLDKNLAYYDGQSWVDRNSSEIPLYTYKEDSIFQGFLEIEENLFTYGSVVPDIVGGSIVSTNLISLGGNESGINNTDGTIYAAVKFQDQYYFAGTFTQMEGIEMNGLALSDGLSPVTQIPEIDLTISSSFNELSLNGQLLNKGRLDIVNNMGQQVISKRIDAGFTRLQIPLDHLPTGVYYFRYESNGILQSDKIVVVH